MSTRYTVHHETEYRYDSVVSVSHQALHLTPQALPYQRCHGHRLRVEPVPTHQVDELDGFGNPITRLEIDTPHRELLVAAEMDIEVDAHDTALDLDDSPSWEDVVATLAYRGGHVPTAAALDANRYRFESPYVRWDGDVAKFVREDFAPGTPLLRACALLMQRIHREFRFDANATQVATPVVEVLENRHGVCQDFAHLMIACLRSLGLAARYVSGYLLTTPPPDQPRLIGADASHAWVSVHCPRQGWIDFDPTNNMRPGNGHITLAWGRDFGDVSPLRGIILGGGAHELDVRVTVVPVTE